MVKKLLGIVVALAVCVSTLVAAEGKVEKQVDKSFTAKVIKIEAAKHTLLIRYKSADGKITEQRIVVPSTVQFTDIKPQTKYTFVEREGKLIAIKPASVVTVVKTPPGAPTPPSNQKVHKSFTARVIKLDAVNHSLLVRCKAKDGKVNEMTIVVPGTLKFGDIKPQTKYTFVEHAGKLIAIKPVPVPTVVQKTQPVKSPITQKFVKAPAQKVVQPVFAVTGPKPQTLLTAQVLARKAEQEKTAAIKAVQIKTAAVQAAVAKLKPAEQVVVAAEQKLTVAAKQVQERQMLVKVTEAEVFRANFEATRAEAAAKVALAKAELAQAEAARARAFAKLTQAQAAVAKIDAGFAGQVKERAVKFMKHQEAAVQAARGQLAHLKQAVVKAVQEQQQAQQVVKQKTQAAAAAAARIHQIQQTEKNQHAAANVKDETKKPVQH
jgi:hypothetical protein